MAPTRRDVVVMGGAASLLASTGIGVADTWPTRTATVISPYPPGGGSDIIARMVADALTESLGQKFIIENIAGAAGALGGAKLARSNPDGYTILVSGSAPLAANKVVQKDLSYDPQLDFTPISLVTETPLLLTCATNVPVHSIKDFIAYARANPDKANIGNPGAGTKGHIAAAILASRAGIKLTHIPYKGSPPLLTDLLGGHVQFGVDTASNYLQNIEEGKVRAIAATSLKRAPRLPSLPTVAEQGIDGFNVTGWFAAVGPKGMPRDITMKIVTTLKTWLATPQAQKKLADISMTPIGSTPEELAEATELEISSIRPLVAAGIVERT